jgi:hypothetical protein
MGPHGLEFGQFIETSWRTVKNITDVDATFWVYKQVHMLLSDLLWQMCWCYFIIY